MVSWSGSDAGSGIISYDVQYRIGTGGTWTDWLTGTTATSHSFGPIDPLVVTHGETYYFRVRAHDAAGTVGVYAGGDGDTHTYIEIIIPVYLPMIIK